MSLTEKELKEKLAACEAPEPPADLLNRCLETIPDIAPKRNGKRYFFTALRARWKESLMMRRVLIGGVALTALAITVTMPVLREDGRRAAASAAWAETKTALQRVTYWKTTSRQIGFDPSGPAENKPWYPRDQWSTRIGWFDAARGIFEDRVYNDGVTVYRNLFLPNGDLCYRQTVYERQAGNRYAPVQKVRITHMKTAWWENQRDQQLASRRNVAQLLNNLGNPAGSPKSVRDGSWKKKPARLLEFDVPPPEYWRKKGAPSLRMVLYIDPGNQLPIARQNFAYWPNRPGQALRLVGEWEYDHTVRPEPILFDLRRFTAGAAEVQEQEGKPGVTLDPE
jgi:hypothetical protein